MIIENAKKVVLPITLNLTEEQWINYSDRYKLFSEIVPEPTFTISLLAYQIGGDFWLSSDEIYTDVLGYAYRTGKRNIELPTGKVVRYSSELGSKHPMAPTTPSFMIPQAVRYLREEEKALLCNPIRIRDPETLSPNSVYPLKVMSIIASSYDQALRQHETDGSIKLNDKQKVRAVILHKLAEQLTEEALRKRLVDFVQPMTLVDRQLAAVSRPSHEIKYRGRAFTDDDWEFFCWLCGLEFDRNDPDRYRKAVFAGKIIARIAYSFLDEEALERLRENKKRGLPLHACLNMFGMRIAKMAVSRLRKIGYMLYSTGSYKQVLADFELDGRELLLDCGGDEELAAKLNQVVVEGKVPEFYGYPKLVYNEG